MKDDKQKDITVTNITTKPTDKEDEPILQFRNSQNEIIAEYEFKKKFTPIKSVARKEEANVVDFDSFVVGLNDNKTFYGFWVGPANSKDTFSMPTTKDLYEQISKHLPKNKKLPNAWQFFKATLDFVREQEVKGQQNNNPIVNNNTTITTPVIQNNNPQKTNENNNNPPPVGIDDAPVVANNNNKNTDDKKNNNQEKRPEVEWWMILLCLVLVGFIFIIITMNKQKEYDEKHNKQAKEINTKPLSYNLDGNKREIEK